MPPSGTFSDVDRAEVVAMLDEKVLRGGFGRLLRRIDGIAIRPASGAVGGPEATVSRPGLVGNRPMVQLSLEGSSEADVERRLAAANMGGPQPRASFGLCIYDFPGETGGTELLDFALRGLRALGAAPADGRWEYTATQPERA
jgi:hypothetical protein